LDYAKQILDHGFEPGILIIDEGWQIEYGCWDFNRDKFTDPKAMIESLHNDGFIVMLWVSPHVRADGERFVKQRMEYFNPDNFRDMFLKNTDGDIAIGSWWNGCSALVDFTKKCDWDFLDNQLQALMGNYGVDGFKFDGGTVSHYSTELINGPAELNYKPYERNIAWNNFGIRYKFHEYKDTFKGGGRRMIQRIRERNHSWDNEGLSTLVPNAILQGILGHPYVCPDMIGGGAWTIRDLGLPVDEELFVRMAQCSAMRYITGEGKTMPDIELAESQIAYLKRAKEYGKKVVAVVFAGRPLGLAEAEKYCDAILWAWHGGTMCGLAAAGILFGEFNPCGKLPVTFPRSTGQIPIHYNHNPNEYVTSGYYSHHKYVSTDSPSTPMYVFGDGLSYTEYEYTDFRCTHGINALEISFDIENTGVYDGYEIAQCYVRDMVASMARPVKELKAFEKVFIPAGEKKTVSLKLEKSDLSFYNARGEFVFEPGEFQIEIGKSSNNICFKTTEYINF